LNGDFGMQMDVGIEPWSRMATQHRAETLKEPSFHGNSVIHAGPKDTGFPKASNSQWYHALSP
jgi:hypothetical protein